MKNPKPKGPRAHKPEALKHALRLAWDEKHAAAFARRWQNRDPSYESEPVNWRDWVTPDGRFTIPKSKGKKK